jgi:protein phosphatase 1 regulatory subunit 10
MAGSHISHNIHDLDQEEGAALHQHLFEETTDWSEPNREYLLKISHDRDED